MVSASDRKSSAFYDQNFLRDRTATDLIPNVDPFEDKFEYWKNLVVRGGVETKSILCEKGFYKNDHNPIHYSLNAQLYEKLRVMYMITTKTAQHVITHDLNDVFYQREFSLLVSEVIMAPEQDDAIC